MRVTIQMLFDSGVLQPCCHSKRSEESSPLKILFGIRKTYVFGYIFYIPAIWFQNLSIETSIKQGLRIWFAEMAEWTLSEMQRELFVCVFHKALVHPEKLTNTVIHFPAACKNILQVFLRKLQAVPAALGRDSAWQRDHLKNKAFPFEIPAHFYRIIPRIIYGKTIHFFCSFRKFACFHNMNERAHSFL